MKSWWLPASLGVVLVSIHPATTTSATKFDLVGGYRSWKRVTPDPVNMPMALVLSCIGPARWDQKDNPHVAKVFLVYVNGVGEKAMMAKGLTHFPEGTVIVKEKYDSADLGEPHVRDVMMVDRLKPTAKPVLLTVMSKQGGTWSYFTVDGTGRKVADGDPSCAKCHEINRKSDYAFRTYVPGAKVAAKPW